MARFLRNLPVGCAVHIVNRGNDKRVLFDDARHFEEFLALVARVKRKCPVEIVSYNIMSNHWHFVMWIQIAGDVSRFLHLLTSMHAQRWRRRTGTVGQGHVYQDRFHSSPIYSERRYLNVLRYVEQNALRASIVERASDWRWSSYYERSHGSRGIIARDDHDPSGLKIDWDWLVDDRLPEDMEEEVRHDLRRY